MMNPRESLTQRLSTHLSTKQSFTPRDSGDSGDSGLFGLYLCLSTTLRFTNSDHWWQGHESL